MKAEISALVDDELAPESAGPVFEALRRDPELRGRWDCYHLVGDVLRLTPALSPGFSANVMCRVAREAPVLAPMASIKPVQGRLRAALSLAAAAMGMGVVAWVALSTNGGQPGRVAEARSAPSAPSATAVPARSAPALQHGAIKEYLLAHQAYSPSNRIQGVAPAVRTVSEIRQDARK